MVSSKDIQKARRVASRSRAALACTPCRLAKLKCNDYRPCKRCKQSNQATSCGDYSHAKVLFIPLSSFENFNPEVSTITCTFQISKIARYIDTNSKDQMQESGPPRLPQEPSNHIRLAKQTLKYSQGG